MAKNKKDNNRMSLQESQSMHNMLVLQMTAVVEKLKEELSLLETECKVLEKADRIECEMKIIAVRNEIKSKQNYIDQFKKRIATQKDVTL
jgi:hypothetical protein